MARFRVLLLVVTTVACSGERTQADAPSPWTTVAALVDAGKAAFRPVPRYVPRATGLRGQEVRNLSQELFEADEPVLWSSPPGVDSVRVASTDAWFRTRIFRATNGPEGARLFWCVVVAPQTISATKPTLQRFEVALTAEEWAEVRQHAEKPSISALPKAEPDNLRPSVRDGSYDCLEIRLGARYDAVCRISAWSKADLRGTKDMDAVIQSLFRLAYRSADAGGD